MYLKEYDIKITETLEKTVTVKAESMEAAQAKVEEAVSYSVWL